MKVELALRELILAVRCMAVHPFHFTYTLFRISENAIVSTSTPLTSTEIRDIILGQEIAAPTVQRQQMAELEKSTEAQNPGYRNTNVGSASYRHNSGVPTA